MFFYYILLFFFFECLFNSATCVVYVISVLESFKTTVARDYKLSSVLSAYQQEDLVEVSTEPACFGPSVNDLIQNLLLVILTKLWHNIAPSTSKVNNIWRPP